MAFSKRPKTLLDILPDEIRRRIWELALVEDAHINTSDAILAAERYNSSKYRACRDGKELPPPPNDAVNSTYPRLQPALLATCHQIRREAFVIYYGENVSHHQPVSQRLSMLTIDSADLHRRNDTPTPCVHQATRPQSLPRDEANPRHHRTHRILAAGQALLRNSLPTPSRPRAPRRELGEAILRFAGARQG